MKQKIVERHYYKNRDKLVKRFSYRVPNKSLALAEEVVQEAYVRALKYFSTFDPRINSFDIWFNKILRNALKDCQNSEKDHGITYQLDENIEELSVTKEEKSQYNIVLQCIEEIKNERDHKIISLFFINGFSSRDISEYLGLTDNNVRQIILRYRKKIQERVDIP